MKYINRMVIIVTLLFISITLVYGPITAGLIMAAPPDICFEEHCPGKGCENNPAGLTATCCWTGGDGKTWCQTCQVNTDSGDFENCNEPHPYFKGQLNDGIVAPPLSGKAPPPSTEKCPDNVAIDKNGNCSPTTQLPGDTSDNNKPNLRGNILNDMMSTQSQESSASGEEQENQSNG